MIAAVYLEKSLISILKLKLSKVKSDIPIQLTNTSRVYNNTFKNAFDENKRWLEALRKFLKCNNDRKIYWSTFHRERWINRSKSCLISTSTLLPLINESINRLMHNVPKSSDTLSKSCSKFCKILKVCLTILGHYELKG